MLDEFRFSIVSDISGDSVLFRKSDNAFVRGHHKYVLEISNAIQLGDTSKFEKDCITQEELIVMEKMGKRLRLIRKHKNLSQADVGKMINVSQATISNIENGSYIPGRPIINRLAYMLAVDEELLTGENDECLATHNLKETIKGISPGGIHKIYEYAKLVKLDEKHKLKA